ncbi:hypothetical protein F4810DRAFT_669150 [Camillea tinctor]|nr:hypothetical protein F4810DRAFT_669150 [Camillea tinctor]
MSSYEQHYYQTPSHVIAAGIVLSLLDILAVSLRFVARGEKRHMKMDDWLLIPATLLTAGVGSCLVFGVSREAFGYREYPTTIEHPSDVAIYQMSTSIKLEWSISLILPVALACTKLSFLFFYKRIFSINNATDKFLKGLVLFICMWAVAFFLATLLCCKTMAIYIWKPISEMAQCKFFLDVLMAFCITGFVTDVAIIIIPIPLIWRLKLSTEDKLIASGSFLLGSVTIAAALARLIVSVNFVHGAADPNNDMILDITLYVYWGMVECSMGVFAACLPTLQLFFRQRAWQRIVNRTRSLLSSRSISMNRIDSQTENNLHLHNMADVLPKEKRETTILQGSRTGSQNRLCTPHTSITQEVTTVREVV